MTLSLVLNVGVLALLVDADWWRADLSYSTTGGYTLAVGAMQYRNASSVTGAVAFDHNPGFNYSGECSCGGRTSGCRPTWPA